MEFQKQSQFVNTSAVKIGCVFIRTEPSSSWNWTFNAGQIDRDKQTLKIQP